MTSLNLHTRIYRTILLAYPRAFRQVYGRDMTQVFSDRLREERSRSGKGAALSVWIFTLLDLFKSAPVQRMEKKMTREAGFALLFGLALAVAVATFAMGIGGPVVNLLTAVLIFGGIVVVATGSLRRGRSGAAGSGDPRTFRRWWVVLAALSGTITIAFGILQYIDDPKVENLGAIGILTFFGGLNLAGCWMRSRSRVGGDWMIAIGVLPFMALWWVVWPAVLGLVVLVSAIADSLRAGTIDTDVAAA